MKHLFDSMTSQEKIYALQRMLERYYTPREVRGLLKELIFSLAQQSDSTTNVNK